LLVSRAEILPAQVLRNVESTEVLEFSLPRDAAQRNTFSLFFSLTKVLEVGYQITKQ
jgi:hypothetical protein